MKYEFSLFMLYMMAVGYFGTDWWIHNHPHSSYQPTSSIHLDVMMTIACGMGALVLLGRMMFGYLDNKRD